jgi:hypothetical protein
MKKIGVFFISFISVSIFSAEVVIIENKSQDPIKIGLKMAQDYQSGAFPSIEHTMQKNESLPIKITYIKPNLKPEEIAKIKQTEGDAIYEIKIMHRGETRLFPNIPALDMKSIAENVKSLNCGDRKVKILVYEKNKQPSFICAEENLEEGWVEIKK